MRLKIRVDRVDTHTHMTVFVNGAMSGRLVMTAAEARIFRGDMYSLAAYGSQMQIEIEYANPSDVGK